MSARFTVDTNILRIRNVIALNPQTDAFIPNYHVPIAGEKGNVSWYSGLDYLSTISVPNQNTNVRTVVETALPGLSTYSTVMGDSIKTSLISTVQGLGTAQYVSTSYLANEITQLSHTYRFISATTLYECFKSLANMIDITNQIGPMALINVPALSNGYVSTINPGEYTIYNSTCGLLGSNLNGIAFNNLSNLTSAQVDIGGYQNHIVKASKMVVDIMTNATITYNSPLASGVTSYVSTFLTKAGQNTPLGTPVTLEIPSGVSNVPLSQVRFHLNKNDLTPYPGTLQLRFRQSNADDTNGTFTTFIPKVGGLFVTLTNVD
jgi:hypothetical protein